MSDQENFEDEVSDDDAFVDEETEAAAQESRELDGPNPDPGLDPAERPVVEGGEGESEGFELAEEELIEHASHGDSGPDPSHMAGEAEEPGGREATYGEADEEEDPDA